MTAPAITTLDAEGLRAAALVLRDVLAATSSLTDAAAVRAMMEREATIAEAILANSVEDEEEATEQALDGLADAAADHLAQAGNSSPGASRVAPSAPAPESGSPRRQWTDAERKKQKERMRARMAGEAIWTEERLALMHREFPTAELPDLLARVNALPGPPVASVDAMRQRAKADGVARDPAWLAERRRQSMLRAIEGKAARASDATARSYTQLEQDVLRDRFRARLTAEGMTQTQGAEAAGIPPGSITPWLSGKSASGIAQKVEEWLAVAVSATETPDHIAEPSKMVPPPAPSVPDAPPREEGSPDDWTEDAQEEARTMLAAGRGARDLSHWFGGALTWWQAWCERERAGERRVA